MKLITRKQKREVTKWISIPLKIWLNNTLYWNYYQHTIDILAKYCTQHINFSRKTPHVSTPKWSYSGRNKSFINHGLSMADEMELKFPWYMKSWRLFSEKTIFDFVLRLCVVRKREPHKNWFNVGLKINLCLEEQMRNQMVLIDFLFIFDLKCLTR